MDPGLPWAEAVAVSDGKVMAVGNYDQMDSIIDDDTEVIDLEERYMLPGFIDIHHSPVMKMIGSDGIDEEEEQEAEEAEEKNIFASMDHAAVYEYADDGEIDEWASDEEEEPKTRNLKYLKKRILRTKRNSTGMRRMRPNTTLITASSIRRSRKLLRNCPTEASQL